MWYGWHYSRGTWHRLCQAEDMLACSRLLDAALHDLGVDPWGPTNQHRRLTRGSYPCGLPPDPRGDGVRRDQ